MKPSLPQYDPNAASRQAELAATRAHFPWDHDFLAPLPLLREKGTEHPNAWQAMLGWEVSIVPKQVHPPASYVVDRWLSLHNLRKNEAHTRKLRHAGTFRSLAEYKQLFVTLPQPSWMKDWPSDEAFTAQRLAGMNPVVITRIDELPAHLAVDDARVAGLVPSGATLASLARDGRLYLSDYGVLEGMPFGAFAGAALYAPPAIGLFLRDDAGALRALAIQLDQSPNPELVVTPLDAPGAWLMAKTFFQVADVNHHEMGTHLCRTHFILEGFAVATARQLPERHPVAVLLRPHFRILLWNNFEGRELLLSPNGFATRLMAGGLAGSAEIVRRSYAGHPLGPVAGRPRVDVAPWDFETWDLPAELARRGVADSAALPDYPFRDDGLLVWNAIRDFVAGYLRLYYASDADVAGDTELQAWAAELADPSLGRVRGLVPPRDLAALTTLLTRIVFACGPLHAAVNFAQYDAAAFAPNMPAAAFARPPAGARSLQPAVLDAFLLEMLPPPPQADLQLKTVTELTSYLYDRLGHYQDGDFTDPGALALVAAFQKSLEGVSTTIQQRNAKRSRPYPWFLPERIPNSTSI